MTDQLSGGLPFAPQPKSYADTAGDYLQQARKWLDNVTPGIGSIAPFLGGAGGAALTGSTQGDILNNPQLLAKIQAHVNSAAPIGGPRGPNSLFGPSTYPQTTAPRPEGFNGQTANPAPTPAATPSVPALGGLGLFPPAAPMAQSPLQTAVATPMNLPQPPRAPAPAPVVASDPGPAGPTSVGGAPLSGYAGVTPQNAPESYGLGARLRNASASLGGDMGFAQRNAQMMRDPGTGDFLDPQAANKAQASGPDLIQKFMTYLHNK